MWDCGVLGRAGGACAGGTGEQEGCSALLEEPCGEGAARRGAGGERVLRLLVMLRESRACRWWGDPLPRPGWAA